MGPQSAAQVIAELLQPVLQQDGFVRRGLRWFRYEEESILVIDVQPAAVLPGPYINLGVYYLRYGANQQPKIVDCHVDTRLMSLVPDPLRGNVLLDPNNEVADDTRREELTQLVHNYGVPWLEMMAKFQSAKTALMKTPLVAHVSAMARPDLVTSARLRVVSCSDKKNK